MKHANCMQLGSSSRKVREEQEEEEVPETVAMLAEPEEQDMDDHESNASTEPIEDVAQDHVRDPEVEWLEPPVEAPVETPAQRMSHSLALRLVWSSPSARSRGMQLFSVPIVCSQMFFFFFSFFGTHGSSGSHGSSSSVLEYGCHSDDEQRTYRHAPSYLAVISTVSGCDLRNTRKLESGLSL